jgi:hypothetical protein
MSSPKNKEGKNPKRKKVREKSWPSPNKNPKGNDVWLHLSAMLYIVRSRPGNRVLAGNLAGNQTRVWVQLLLCCYAVDLAKKAAIMFCNILVTSLAQASTEVSKTIENGGDCGRGPIRAGRRRNQKKSRKINQTKQLNPRRQSNPFCSWSEHIEAGAEKRNVLC